MLQEINRWYAYARWANTHMLDACETVDAAALTRDVGTSFGSLLGTLEHLYGADWIWLERFRGRIPTVWPSKGSLLSVTAFRDAFAALDVERTKFLAGLDEPRLLEPLRYRNLKGEPYEFPLGQLLFHVSNHATYHRGQVMQLVRQFGGTVQGTDYLHWLPIDR
jgi:uncharacterized damage-inducible protein DinB